VRKRNVFETEGPIVQADGSIKAKDMSMRRFYWTILPLLGVLATQAPADASLECSTDAGSQIEIGNCVAKMEKAVDDALVAALGFAMAAAKELDQITERDVAVPALEQAQSGWETYRDTHCDFVGATYGGGSGTGIAIQSCRVELGRARIAELLRYAG
jgi:uncharacterized protein YecT (DUF1311 family)